ncbi:hypothetical protein LY90DRAFT_504417 [Neocallimastix californiae]|uniref:Uncharacterized protein n=1 Tax=Neocallimastix californiae TaxID=1754190 RepID=A0A1Y2E9A9_9FUNG|nr:hypothetical protein LY90DRAFT_504417 [Neocallimastix californiae]|eukprot:ORY68150.1 hypothetical protein LY90DRAFT_504417 [Neocallimastix californiae]
MNKNNSFTAENKENIEIKNGDDKKNDNNKNDVDNFKENNDINENDSSFNFEPLHRNILKKSSTFSGKSKFAIKVKNDEGNGLKTLKRNSTFLDHGHVRHHNSSSLLPVLFNKKFTEKESIYELDSDGSLNSNFNISLNLKNYNNFNGCENGKLNNTSGFSLFESGSNFKIFSETDSSASSQISLKTLSTSSLRKQLSNSYNRLKSNSNEINKIRRGTSSHLNNLHKYDENEEEEEDENEEEEEEEDSDDISDNEYRLGNGKRTGFHSSLIKFKIPSGNSTNTLSRDFIINSQTKLKNLKTKTNSISNIKSNMKPNYKSNIKIYGMSNTNINRSPKSKSKSKPKSKPKLKSNNKGNSSTFSSMDSLSSVFLPKPLSKTNNTKFYNSQYNNFKCIHDEENEYDFNILKPNGSVKIKNFNNARKVHFAESKYYLNQDITQEYQLKEPQYNFKNILEASKKFKFGSLMLGSGIGDNNSGNSRTGSAGSTGSGQKFCRCCLELNNKKNKMIMTKTTTTTTSTKGRIQKFDTSNPDLNDYTSGNHESNESVQDEADSQICIVDEEGGIEKSSSSIDQYQEFLNEEEKEIMKNIERNYNHLRSRSVRTEIRPSSTQSNKDTNKSLKLKTKTKTKQITKVPAVKSKTPIKIIKIKKEDEELSRNDSKKIIEIKSNPSSKSSPIIKSSTIIPENESKEILDQKEFIEPTILDKIHKNRFLKKRLLNNDNIFNILSNPIIKISKKKYYNDKSYYRNGVLKKRNIGKILYNNFVLKNTPFKNYFKEEGHNILGRDLYPDHMESKKSSFSSSVDRFLHQPYSSQHQLSSYNNIKYSRKLTYIKHQYRNCKIKIKPKNVVGIGKPMKALIKWRDHSFSRIPTISKKVHGFDAMTYLYELNDTALSGEEKAVYECCPLKYDSVSYRKNLYKLQKEILNDYIKESNAIITQKYPNIGSLGNVPDGDLQKIKEKKSIIESKISAVGGKKGGKDSDENKENEEEEEEEEKEEENKGFKFEFDSDSDFDFDDEEDVSEDEIGKEKKNQKNKHKKSAYPSNMTLEEYLRMYEEMLENKLKKPRNRDLKNKYY